MGRSMLPQLIPAGRRLPPGAEQSRASDWQGGGGPRWWGPLLAAYTAAAGMGWLPSIRCHIVLQPALLPHLMRLQWVLTVSCHPAHTCPQGDQFGYCPPWALAWPYRKLNLLKELLAYDADIMCLQEVQSNHFQVRCIGVSRGFAMCLQEVQCNHFQVGCCVFLFHHHASCVLPCGALGVPQSIGLQAVCEAGRLHSCLPASDACAFLFCHHVSRAGLFGAGAAEGGVHCHLQEEDNGAVHPQLVSACLTL